MSRISFRSYSRNLRFLKYALLVGFVFAAPMLAGPLAAQGRLALIVGSNYKGNASGIPPLDLCEADANLMKKTLETHGGFKHVEVLLGKMVTSSRLEKAIDTLSSKAGSKDTVVLYFSGHGTYQRDSSAPNGLRNYIVMYDRPHVPDNVLNTWVGKIKTPKLVWIFDCCYSGGIAKKGKKSRGQGDVPIDDDQKGKVIENGKDIYFQDKAIMASSDANETSIEVRGGINHGIFTYYLAQGLQPRNGDLNKDGTVTALEAFEWTKTRVIKKAKEFNHRQTPQISGHASGILIAGKTDPKPPEPEPVKPDPEPVTPDPEPQPEPGPTPPDVEDPVTPDEPDVVEHDEKSKAVIVTTIYKSMQAGPTPMNPVQILARNKRGNDDRRIKVTVSGNEYETKISWLDARQLKARTGETIPLGWYTYKGKRYKNQVALIEVSGIPTGVHEIEIQADGYPIIQERLGVEDNSRNNELFVVTSLADFGMIRGKVFYKNFEQPLRGQTVWMPVVKTVNQQHKMKTTSDGSFWFLNLPPGADYFIKPSFAESTPLDDKYLTVEAGKVTTVDVVLKVKTGLR